MQDLCMKMDDITELKIEKEGREKDRNDAGSLMKEWNRQRVRQRQSDL